MSTLAIRRAQALLVCVAVVAQPATVAAQLTADQQADMVLGSARRAYSEKNYSFAIARFRELLQKYAGHPHAASAHYGLARCLLEGPDKDYAGAASELQPLAANKTLPDHPRIMYYLGLALRGQGIRALAQAAAKPTEAGPQRQTALQRFEEAAGHFGSAAAALKERLPRNLPATGQVPVDVDWVARARCDQAEMLLCLGKVKEARAATAPLVSDPVLSRSRYLKLALYYDGFAGFLAGDARGARRSLQRLSPYVDPSFGTHARYLLARIAHEAGQRVQARANYEAVLADHDRHKQAAAQELGQPDRFKNDPDEKSRLQRLAQGPPPEHVARAAFFLGVLIYEEGHFADALARFTAFAGRYVNSPLAAEAQLHRGCCQVQLKQWDEAVKTLQPLADKELRLADQALLWLAKAQLGKADTANPAAHQQSVRAALDTLRLAAGRADQVAASDPGAVGRRGEILLETADALQQVKQYREAAALYKQLLTEKVLPERCDEILHGLAAALQLAGDYEESDKVCKGFCDKFSKSHLTPAVLLRHADSAYCQALAVEKNPDANYRRQETSRLNGEAVKRYEAVLRYHPPAAHANLARLGLALAHYRRAEFNNARAALRAIPAADRTGRLSLVGYYLADIAIRTAPPARPGDPGAAGELAGRLREAAEQLETFVGSAAEGPEAADGLLKLGYCHQRIAALSAQPAEQAMSLAAARAAYEQLLQRFPRDPSYPSAVFERAKVLAQTKDTAGAANELRRFLNDPLKGSGIAPMGVLYLATLMQAENKPAEAAAALDQCRREHEAQLQADPARAGWVPLLRYHHGICLRDAGKRPEARGVLELVVGQNPDRPEAADAALCIGQCLKEEAEARIDEGRRKLAQPNLSANERAAAEKAFDEGAATLRQALQYLVAQAEQLRQKRPACETRERMLYESAWLARGLAGLEVEAARQKLQQELWQKRRDEAAKSTPPGQLPPFVLPPELALTAVPLQPAEAQARAQYRALLAAFPNGALHTDARFELAELLAERGEHDAAVKLLEEALHRKPFGELANRIHLRLGDVLLRKGDARGALAQLNPVADNAGSAQCAQATYRCGEAWLRLGEPAEAVKRLAHFRDKAELQNVPAVSDRALLRLSHALALMRQWEPSRQAAELVINRFAGGPWANEARYAVAWAYQNMGQYDNAVSWYSQLTAHAATELAARAQLNIGLCRLQQKHYAEAATALLVVPYTYDYPRLAVMALVEAARALALDKQEDQAARLLQRVVRDHPGTPEAQVAGQRLAGLANH
jgi:TolA-binding protein